MRSSYPNTLARTVRSFFSEYLTEQRGMSRHTVLSYRDTLILLLRFVATSQHHDPATLDLPAISSRGRTGVPELPWSRNAKK